MAISSPVRKAGPYVADGTTASYSFDFKVFTEADIAVVRADTLGVETVLVIDRDYSVTLNPDQNETPGGLVVLASTPAFGQRIVLLSNVPYDQPVDATNQGGFYPEVLNDGLDRATIQAQQTRELLGRQLTLPVTAPADVSLEVPTPKANQFLAWDESGKKLVTYDPSNIIGVIAFGSTRVDKFDGDGTTTTFALTWNPGLQNNLRISIDGVMQIPGEDFTWSNGTGLVFAEPPPADTRIMAQYQEALVDTGNALVDLSNAFIPPLTLADTPAAPAVILQKDATPERFGVTPNMKAGLADFSDVLQRMMDSTQQTQADAKKALILSGGDYVLEQQASITCGNYDGGAFSLIGQGGKTARLIAHPDNTQGLVKVTRAHNMETVHIEGVAFCSRLLQRTANAVLNAKNPGYATAPINKNNGVAVFIDGPLPGAGVYGVEDMTAIRVLRNLWCGIGEDSDLTAWNGIWHKALHVQGAWFGEFIGNHFTGLFEADCAAGFVNGNNVKAMHLEHCYAPDIFRNKFNGVWDVGAHLEGKEAGAGADISARFGVRWEGGRMSENIFGGLTKDAAIISHEYPAGTLQSPGFQISNNHVNFRRNGIVINGHRQIESTSNEFYARETPNPFGEALPAAYKLTDCGDFDSTNDAFLEIGWRQSDTNAFVCYRVVDKLQGFKAHGPRFNCNGIGLHISAPTGASSPDPTVYTRSFQVLDAVEGGRRAFDLWGTAGFKKYVDLSGVRGIAWETIEQVNGSDLKRIISNASEPTNTVASGLVHDTDNADYATRNNPLAGYVGARARNSGGTFIPGWYMQTRFTSNAAGSETAIVDLYVRRNGQDVPFMSYDGQAGWVLTGANRALKVGKASSAWGVNPPANQPTITGSRSTQTLDVLFQMLEALGSTQGTGVWVNGTTN